MKNKKMCILKFTVIGLLLALTPNTVFSMEKTEKSLGLGKLSDHQHRLAMFFLKKYLVENPQQFKSHNWPILGSLFKAKNATPEEIHELELFFPEISQKAKTTPFVSKISCTGLEPIRKNPDMVSFYRQLPVLEEKKSRQNFIDSVIKTL